MKVLFRFVLAMTLLAGGVFAQIGTEPRDLAVAGKQTSVGSYNAPFAETRGNTFVLDGSDSPYTSLLFTVSFDFVNDVDFDNGNEISGGQWNLAIYKTGQYQGSIFGKVSEGYIRWAASEDLRQTDASITILGGTGIFEGTAQCDGYLRTLTVLSSGQTNAVITGLPF